MEDFDDYDAQLLGCGASAVVLAVNEDFVVKFFPSGSKPSKELRREIKIYRRLSREGRSPYILSCFERWGNGIVLERCEMTLHQRLKTREVSIELQDLWISEVANGAGFLHSRGVLHGDLSCHNILVDYDGHAKLCDFAGSKAGKKNARGRYQVRNQHPEFQGLQPTVETEVFALGSVIFEITTLQAPYAHLPDMTIRELFEEGNFPLDCIVRPEIRDIVEGCWRGGYEQVSDVCNDLELLRV